jgi:uncharacterized membrane protein
MHIKTAVLGAVAAGIIIAGGVGITSNVSAQDPGTDPTPAADTQKSPGGRFLERVAEKLGVSPDTLRQAMRDAARDAVNEALAQGRITQEQADRANEAIDSGKGLRGFLERQKDRREDRRDNRLNLVRRGIVESSAAALNMSADELRAELKAGKSIADVAGEQGVSLDAVKTRITSDAEARLNEQVAAGNLTQERADQALAKLTGRLDDILQKSKQPAPAP